MNYSAALNQYKTVGVQGSVTDASPHQMITLLLNGAQDRIATARGAITRNEVARKGELIGKAIAIVDNLRASLDHEQGGQISADLAALYDYIERSLVEANLQSDQGKLDEASAVLKQIQEGWAGIADYARQEVANVGR